MKEIRFEDSDLKDLKDSLLNLIENYEIDIQKEKSDEKYENVAGIVRRLAKVYHLLEIIK